MVRTKQNSKCKKCDDSTHLDCWPVQSSLEISILITKEEFRNLQSNVTSWCRGGFTSSSFTHHQIYLTDTCWIPRCSDFSYVNFFLIFTECHLPPFLNYGIYTSICYVCMYVCMYVQLSARTLVGSPYSAGTRCAYTHTHTHMRTCPCTAHPIPPLRDVLSQELNGVGWPVPFPLRTAHNQATMKCITWLKICNTNLIYLLHPQADNNN
jgi:hypothetical protein